MGETDSLNYERENQKEHIEIGKVYYHDSEKEQTFIATLELFGNGYDVIVYEDDELQYINRCVVRETSYEFLQYTDDGEMLIVRVNGDLFIMIEQQFELIRDYYDMLNNISNLDKYSQVSMAKSINNVKGRPLNITQTDFQYLVRQLNTKMGFIILGDAIDHSGFRAFKCQRDKEEFGIGCLIENRKVSKNDIKLLCEVGDRNFIIFSYFDYGVSSVKNEYGQDIDIICGNDFIRMIKEHLKIDIE